MKINRRDFAAGLATMAVPAATAKASPRPPRPSTVPDAIDSLSPPVAREVDRYLREKMTEIGIPGMSVAIVQQDRLAWLRHYGMASLEFAVPVSGGTVFAINSITKAFTGVAAMRLFEQGRLDPDSPVGSLLEGLPEAWRRPTVRQLLSHMSGLPDVTRAPTVETDAARAWAWVLEQPVLFPPGERFHYCQTNYTLIQRVLNRLQGRAPDATLADEQLRIAAMTSTAYGDSGDLILRKAPTYRWTRAQQPGAARELKVASERFLPFRRASSGLNSTAADLARWLIALDRGALLGPAAKEAMWTPVRFGNDTPGQWGLGWQVLQRGPGRAVGMTGGGRAAVYLYPEQRLGVAILTNLAGAYPEDMVDKIASTIDPGIVLSGVPALRLALDDRGYDKAAEVARALQAADPSLRWSEAELNDWGYRLLATGRQRQALFVLSLTADLFPASGNAQDSLAEAYLQNGDRAAAIDHYRRSLELDPGNDNARTQLQRLTGIEGQNPPQH